MGKTLKKTRAHMPARHRGCGTRPVSTPAALPGLRPARTVCCRGLAPAGAASIAWRWGQCHMVAYRHYPVYTKPYCLPVITAVLIAYTLHQLFLKGCKKERILSEDAYTRRQGCSPAPRYLSHDDLALRVSTHNLHNPCTHNAGCELQFGLRLQVASLLISGTVCGLRCSGAPLRARGSV